MSWIRSSSFLHLGTVAGTVGVATLLFSCDPQAGSSSDPSPSGGHLQFTQIAETTPSAWASTINVSPNEQYMLISYYDNTTPKLMYSTDGGATLTRYTNSNLDRQLVETSISNDGKFVYGGYTHTLASTVETLPSQTLAVTASGKIVNIQNDAQTGQPTFHLYEDGAFVSTGVVATLDKSYFCGTSGEQLGFFYGNKVGIFDATTRTYTEKELTLDFSRLYGNGLVQKRTKRVFNDGYFAYAKEGGCLIASFATGEVNYYHYPKEYQIYLNTEGGIKLYGDKAYVNLLNYAGEARVFETEGDSVHLTPYQFPLCQVGDNLYTQGFLENGARIDGGLIKYTKGTPAYLPATIENSRIGACFLFGDHLYFASKLYNRQTKTFRTSPIGEIKSVLYTDGGPIAYTTTGTYSSTDGNEWTLRSVDEPRPLYFTRTPEGLYYGLGIGAYTYVSPGTGFSMPQYKQTVYTSTDGIDWEELPGSKKEALGGSPKMISPNGVIAYKENITPFSNATYVYQISRDFGVTYERMPEEEAPAHFRLTNYRTRDGRYINLYYDTGRLQFVECSDPNENCTVRELTTSFEYSSINDMTYTQNDELLISVEGNVYLSGRL